MSMRGLFEFSRTFSKHAAGAVTNDDDAVDKANRVYTMVFLMLSCILVTMSSYVGDPLACWNQGPLSGHDNYINQICWISNTYWLPMYDEIPNEIPEREDKEINYYQWVPIILIIQALLFVIPRMVWRAVRERPGISLKRMARELVKADAVKPAERKKIVDGIAQHLRVGLSLRMLQRHNKLHRAFYKYCCCLFRFDRGDSGARLFNSYIFVKFLYLLNSSAQLFGLDFFLRGEWSSWYGLQIIHNMQHHHAWKETGKFPRVTMCDFEIRVLGNLHRHTVQCVLPVNMYNEKIFLILWFWLAALSLANMYSILSWMSKVYRTAPATAYVKNFIRRAQLSQDPSNGKKVVLTTAEKAAARRFALKFLRADGIFALMILDKNTNDLVATSIVKKMWDDFLEEDTKYQARRKDTEVDERGTTKPMIPTTQAPLPPPPPQDEAGALPEKQAL